jgi:hypothetical protein
MSVGGRFVQTIGRVGVSFLAASVLLGVAGCTGSVPGATKSTGTVGTGAETSSSMKSGGTNSASVVAVDVQKCANCAGKGMAPMVDGTVGMSGGMQVVSIGVKNGYYDPNQFMAKSGVPIKVVFTGKAMGCLGKPQFKSLGKKADFTASGTATIELGALEPGTYEFTCGMGMTGGKIVVQ